MSPRRAAKTILALLTAYVLAVQVVLVAISCPFLGGAALAAQAVCSHSGSGGSLPAGPDSDCGCVVACAMACCAMVSPPRPALQPISYAPTARKPTIAAELARPFGPAASAAHRSRAPPVA